MARAFARRIDGYAAEMPIEDASEQPDTTSEHADDDTVETAVETDAGPDQDAEPPGEDGQSAGTADRPPADS